jgi:O-antigen ligase
VAASFAFFRKRPKINLPALVAMEVPARSVLGALDLAEMPEKPHVNDYEPVTRSQSSRPDGDSEKESWFGASRPHRDPDSAGDRAHSARQTPRLANAGSKQNTRPSLKRGHGVAFAGLFLFTFVVYFRPYELFSWLSWASSMAFVLAVLTLLAYLPTQLGLEGNLTTRPLEINLVLLLLLCGAFSVPLALDKTAAFYGLNEFLKVVLMFIVMVNVVRTDTRLKAMLLLALITSCIVSAAAVNDYRMGVFLRDLDHNRIRGSIGNLFDNPNDLALHLVTMVPLAIGLLFGLRGGLKRLFFAGCAVLISVGVVATFSRGGFIGLVCVAAVLAWRLAKRNKFLIIAGLPIVLLLFLVLAPGGYKSRISSTTDDSGIARREELKRSLFVAIRHPLFGVGINNYILFSDLNHATHNAYTQVASEMGLPAMMIYILFLVTPLKALRRIGRETSATRRTSRYYYLAVGLEASLIGYMVSSFFLSVAYLWYVYYLVGYAICFRRLYEASLIDEGGQALPLPEGQTVGEPVSRDQVGLAQASTQSVNR